MPDEEAAGTSSNVSSLDLGTIDPSRLRPVTRQVMALYDRLAADGLLASPLPTDRPAVRQATAHLDELGCRQAEGEGVAQDAIDAALAALEQAYRDLLSPRCDQCGKPALVLMESAAGAYTCRACMRAMVDGLNGGEK